MLCLHTANRHLFKLAANDCQKDEGYERLHGYYTFDNKLIMFTEKCDAFSIHKAENNKLCDLFSPDLSLLCPFQ